MVQTIFGFERRKLLEMVATSLLRQKKGGGGGEKRKKKTVGNLKRKSLSLAADVNERVVLTSHLAGQESAYTYGKSNQDQ
jgi:hypothetical protein